MKNILLSIIMICCAIVANAQFALPPKTPDSNGVYRNVDELPEPDYDMNKYLNKNMKYPAEARMKNIEGRVNIGFIVSENGAIINPRLLGKKPIGGGCEEEALCVVNAMPPWKPGKMNGKPVKVYYTLPISFQLSGEERR